MAIVKTKFAELPVAVISAFDAANNSSFFMSFKWFANFVETVAKPMNVDACVFYENSIEPPIILPAMLLIEQSLRKIKSLGNYYSPIFSILNNDQLYHASNTENFFTKLRLCFAEWDVIEIHPLSSCECNFLRNQLNLAGIPTISFFCFGNWYLDVNGRSFKEYFFSLSSRLTNTVLRKSKKFFSIEGARIEIFTNEQNFDEGLASYQTVYNASWKVSEPYSEFIPGLMRIAASIGSLRLGVAYLGGKPIASQFWIVTDKTAYIYKLAYNENYKQYSIGTILTAKMMEYVIDVDEVEIVDYLCGDDKYKKDWMSNRCERYGIIGFNTSTLKGFFAYNIELTKLFIKSVLNFLRKNTNKSLKNS